MCWSWVNLLPHFKSLSQVCRVVVGVGLCWGWGGIGVGLGWGWGGIGVELWWSCGGAGGVGGVGVGLKWGYASAKL